MSPVTSSNLKAVGYDPASQALEVHFKNGTRFRYAKVPPEAHAELMAAESPGGHFHRHIRARYEGVRLTGDGDKP